MLLSFYNLGPDPATTIIAEEILMNFVHNKEESEKDVDTTYNFNYNYHYINVII